MRVLTATAETPRRCCQREARRHDKVLDRAIAAVRTDAGLSRPRFMVTPEDGSVDEASAPQGTPGGPPAPSGHVLPRRRPLPANRHVVTVLRRCAASLGPCPSELSSFNASYRSLTCSQPSSTIPVPRRDGAAEEDHSHLHPRQCRERGPMCRIRRGRWHDTLTGVTASSLDALGPGRRGCTRRRGRPHAQGLQILR